MAFFERAFIVVFMKGFGMTKSQVWIICATIVFSALIVIGTLIGVTRMLDSALTGEVGYTNEYWRESNAQDIPKDTSASDITQASPDS